MNTLRQAAQDYLAMRRALGFKLQDSGKYLLDFVAFMEQHRASGITVALALTWANQCAHDHSQAWAARRLSIVRLFARYRSATDPATEIPPAELLPYRPQRARPYLYSDQEIEQLLQAALNRPLSPHDPNRCALLPWVYYCFFGLLAVTGMRLSEAQNLKLHDIDLDTGVLTIRGAKFGKDRLVPLHASTCRVLADYLIRRERYWAGRPVSPYVFVSSWGNRLDKGQIHRAFYAASRQAGLRGVNDRHGPRLHDLRHRFATATLVHWYQSGEDAGKRLPLLSAFLGHVHVADTQWYLSGSPELMHEAMTRLERHWEQRS
ncbi:MAG: tyrosine-type recombinase/integrase [Sinobacteraceae bacterium]|nr:tyrosine-type recombinase/integrase [Nevskiaceae bacterium]